MTRFSFGEYPDKVAAGMIAPLNIAPGAEERHRSELEEAHAAVEVEIAARVRLERALVETVDQERHRMAQMLHDTACQSLNGIGLLSRVIRRRLERGEFGVVGEVAELEQAIGGAIREIQSVVRQLRLSGENEHDLAPALRRVVDFRPAHIPCELECPEGVVIKDRFAAEQLIQIAHQAVSDAVRRTGVQHVLVTIATQGPVVTLTVRGDGDADAAEPDGEWLDGRELMRLRARAIGASLAYSYQANRGTTITCILSQDS